MSIAICLLLILLVCIVEVIIDRRCNRSYRDFLRRRDDVREKARRSL